MTHWATRLTLIATLAAGAALSVTGCTRTGDKPVVHVRNDLDPLFENLETQTTGFSVGRAPTGKRVYVFFDPQCGHCAQLWRNSQAVLEEAKFTWLPVGMLNPNSVGQGATILAAENPAQTMDQHEALLAKGEGGVQIDKVALGKFAQAIKTNSELFQVMRGSQVPFLLYRSASGKIYNVSAALNTAQIQELLASE